MEVSFCLLFLLKGPNTIEKLWFAGPTPPAAEGSNILSCIHTWEFKDFMLKFPLPLFMGSEPVKDSKLLRKTSICNSCVAEGA